MFGFVILGVIFLSILNGSVVREESVSGDHEHTHTTNPDSVLFQIAGQGIDGPDDPHDERGGARGPWAARPPVTCSLPSPHLYLPGRFAAR